jgi:hypothetical protein
MVVSFRRQRTEIPQCFEPAALKRRQSNPRFGHSDCEILASIPIAGEEAKTQQEKFDLKQNRSLSFSYRSTGQGSAEGQSLPPLPIASEVALTQQIIGSELGNRRNNERHPASRRGAGLAAGWVVAREDEFPFSDFLDCQALGLE